MNSKIKSRKIKALVFLLELLGFGLIIYLVILPIFPKIKYELDYQGKAPNTDWQNIEVVKEKTEKVIKEKNNLPKANYSISQNRIIIPKIGVNSPIIESKNEEYALNRGSWILPEGSTPDKVGNTIITGHRFKYLPPNNLTFYLFHKLEVGDVVSVLWKKENYYYKIKEIKTVDKHDLSILKENEKNILTLFTCDPIYSQDNRLVVIGELVE